LCLVSPPSPTIITKVKVSCPNPATSGHLKSETHVAFGFWGSSEMSVRDVFGCPTDPEGGSAVHVMKTAPSPSQTITACPGFIVRLGSSSSEAKWNGQQPGELSIGVVQARQQVLRRHTCICPSISFVVLTRVGRRNLQKPGWHMQWDPQPASLTHLPKP